MTLHPNCWKPELPFKLNISFSARHQKSELVRNWTMSLKNPHLYRQRWQTDCMRIISSTAAGVFMLDNACFCNFSAFLVVHKLGSRWTLIIIKIRETQMPCTNNDIRWYNNKAVIQLLTWSLFVAESLTVCYCANALQRMKYTPLGLQRLACGAAVRATCWFLHTDLSSHCSGGYGRPRWPANWILQRFIPQYSCLLAL